MELFFPHGGIGALFYVAETTSSSVTDQVSFLKALKLVFSASPTSYSGPEKKTPSQRGEVSQKIMMFFLLSKIYTDPISIAPPKE